MRASRFSVVEGFGITGSPCEMSPKVKPVGNGAARPPNRDQLMFTRLRVSGILQSPLDNRRGLNAHHCRTSLIEMECILEKVSVLGHKSMLIIDGNSLRFDESSSDGIPRFNAGIRGAVRCLRFDRGNRSPDELAVTWERPNGLKKNGEAGLELRFGVAPAVQAVVEVNYSEGDTLKCGKFGDLARKARIAYRRRRRQEIDIGDANEILGYLREVTAGDRVAEKKHVGQLGVGGLRPNLPRPLDLFGNRGLALGADDYRLRGKTETENSKRSKTVACCGYFHDAISSHLQLSIKAYTLLTASSTIATVRPAMPKPKSSLADRPACFHSPVKTPAKVAVMIIKICNSPHPTDVPNAPRYVALIPYKAKAPIQRTPIREERHKSGGVERNKLHVRFFVSSHKL